MDLPGYERLGSFYLGNKFDLGNRKLLAEKVLYDAKDLTTHALCVGMTGSGKTGLCLALLEEAALDGIPAIAVDPKGDLGNLLLAFPNLAPVDFLPWLEESDAAKQGLNLTQLAEKTATLWRNGLQQWDQDAARVARFRAAADITIYTPGSTAGIPLTVLRSFDAPPQAVLDDAESMRERVSAAASGLLTLLDLDGDPLTSREHILLANILEHSWRAGRNLDLGMLIRLIQDPPMSKVGVFDLNSFFPSDDRAKLAMRLNNLLASPAFAGWLEGEPLDIKRLLYTPEGKPRLSILSISHLNDSERMFFVTMLLNELLSWVRAQSGTNSLRALFYMDEVFGYFPPTAKPPSKQPMLVLLKQARAFGLGVVLATQNPVDLDYKGLSNIGTWFLGRLQTQRDKERVLDGLEGAAVQSGSLFNRSEMEQTLAALGNRVFLMNNVHDDNPTILQSRWAMSFLRGPLSRPQIQTLMDQRRRQLADQSSLSPAKMETEPSAERPAGASSDSSVVGTAGPAGQGGRPILPSSIVEMFCSPTASGNSSSRKIYLPSVMAMAACHYVKASAEVDAWVDFTLVVPTDKTIAEDLWSSTTKLPRDSLVCNESPLSGFEFANLPDDLLAPNNFKRWEKQLADHLYRHEPMRLFTCPELNATSEPGQDELDARLSWRQRIGELRDAEKEKLRDRYAEKLRSLESKIAAAQQKVEREKAEYDRGKVDTLINFGTTVLGALLGNKLVSRTNISRTSTAVRSVGRASQQRSDVEMAVESFERLEQLKAELVEQFEADVQSLQSQFSVERLTVQPLEIPCRKSDIRIDKIALLWIPAEIAADRTVRTLVPLFH